MIKYLRREDLLSQDKDTSIVTYPGSKTNDMLDYIKPIIRRKSDALLIYSGTNDLTNNINTMKKLRDLVKCVRNLDFVITNHRLYLYWDDFFV